ncbi:unnamed protein product [Rhizoctonia solani]|uniref:NodB homology domain-containing protein n=1 Tax=Rhizoctonia solani TaxID=456999 RepID=A0A8H3CPM5_9AGAM|nr:unnamed protein product [Rhizoctonia solani]
MSSMRSFAVVAALFGAMSVSAAPLDAPELTIRAPAAAMTKCTQPQTVAPTSDDGPYVNTKKLADLLYQNGAEETWLVNGKNYGYLYDSNNAASVITSCSQPNTAAITFDDGPYTWTRTIVDKLDAAGAKGTFFVNGKNFDCIYSGNNPSNLKYAYDQGHQVASHTWSHPHLPTLSASQIEDELTRINTAIEGITGAVPAFIRPPYGEYNQDVLDVAGSLGQTATTANELLDEIIPLLQGAGYSLVTVAECVEMDPYLSQGEPTGPTGSC